MSWKAFSIVLGGIVFFIGAAETIHELIYWDNEYRELILAICKIVIGLSLYRNGRKESNGELMTDEQDKKEDKDSTS